MMVADQWLGRQMRAEGAAVATGSWRRLATLMLISAVLAGCSTQVGKREIDQGAAPPAVETHPDQGVTVTTPQSLPQAVPTRIITQPLPGGMPRNLAESNPNPAVLALSQQADAARAAGRTDQAESAIGRALRIDPNNAFLWNSLASLHLAEQFYDLADNEARRSSSLGRGNPNLDVANWRIIAEACQARGDSAGALQARAAADEAQRRVVQAQ
jgi:Flp pilus assembly protein TadD